MKQLTNPSDTPSDRRIFLKKAVYHAPSLIIMGALSKPISTVAGGVNSDPIGPPTRSRARRP